MIQDDEIKDKSRDLRLLLARAIGETACTYFGNKADENGFTLEGVQIEIFVKALGPLFVTMVTAMGMNSTDLVAAVISSCDVLDENDAEAH